MTGFDLEHEKTRIGKGGEVFFTEKAMTIDREQMLMVTAESIDQVLGPQVLEMGFTDRGWTEALLDRNFQVTVIEGSEAGARHALEKYGGRIDFRNVLFEEFSTPSVFDTVVMSCILEHVADPVYLLRRAATWLREGGRIVIVVPNKHSLHRRIGFSLGMLGSLHDLSPQDLEVGHRRYYDADLMLQHIREAGMEGRFEKGIFLKPLSSDGMRQWSRELLWAFNEVGRFLPEWSAFLLFSAWKKSGGE